MRAFALTAAGALLISAQLAATMAKAEDTTVIRRSDDNGSSTTVIKKKPEVRVLPVPHESEKKVIIHRDE
jgi:hypothetical protein